jgi:peptidylprolyl isomerase
MNAHDDENDTRAAPRSPLRSEVQDTIMARVFGTTARLRAAAVALGLVVTLLTVVAFACGGDEESPSNGATSTAPPGSLEFPTIGGGFPTASGGCLSPGAGPSPPEVQAKTYPEPPAMTIDPSRRYLGHVSTTRGHFIIELLPQVAPEHVNSFVFLTRERFYNGVVFHRVEPGFVVQGGDPTGTGTGGPGYTLPLEPSDEPFSQGVVGMARSQDPNSAGSQWFVTLGDAPHLNGQYTVFGKVAQGMEIVDCLEVGDAIVDIAIQEI